jgi:hypothetical protein
MMHHDGGLKVQHAASFLITWDSCIANEAKEFGGRLARKRHSIWFVTRNKEIAPSVAAGCFRK